MFKLIAKQKVIFILFREIKLEQTKLPKQGREKLKEKKFELINLVLKIVLFISAIYVSSFTTFVKYDKEGIVIDVLEAKG